MSNILIVEPTIHGHHEYILKLILDGCSNFSKVSWLHNLSDKEMGGLCRKTYAHVNLVKMHPVNLGNFKRCPSLKIFLDHFALSLEVVKTVYRCKPRVLFFACIDPFVYLMPILQFMLFPTNVAVAGITFDGRFSSCFYPEDNNIRSKKKIIRFSLERKFLALLFSVNEFVIKSFQKEMAKMHSRLIFLPDPVPVWPMISKQAARKTLNLDLNKKYLLMFGGLSLRKGLKEAVELVLSGVLPDEAVLVICGRINLEVREYLSSIDLDGLISKGKIIFKCEYIPEEDVANYFFASDIIMTNYVGHFSSSGVVLKAALANRSVIAPNVGWVGWAVSSFLLGNTYDPNDPKDFVLKTLDLLNRDNKASDNHKRNEFIEAHSEKKFVSLLSQALTKLVF